MKDTMILFRYSKKTGRIDKTLEGLSLGLLKIWALTNTTKTKNTIIIERVTGNVMFLVKGSKECPVAYADNLGHCTEYNIPFEAVQG